MNLLFPALYVANIVVSNYLFTVVPMIDTVAGTLSPVAIIVGVTFVLRDFAQRAVHHWVLLCMVIACILTYLTANPYIALASALAFGASEIADYAIYTFTKMPFHHRVLWSSALSTPVDTVVFLYLVNALTPGTVVLMIVSKMIAAAVIYLYMRDRQPVAA